MNELESQLRLSKHKHKVFETKLHRQQHRTLASMRAIRGDLEEHSRKLGNTIEEMISKSIGWNEEVTKESGERGGPEGKKSVGKVKGKRPFYIVSAPMGDVQPSGGSSEGVGRGERGREKSRPIYRMNWMN